MIKYAIVEGNCKLGELCMKENGLAVRIKERPVVVAIMVEVLFLLLVFTIPRLVRHTEYHFSGAELETNCTPIVSMDKGDYRVVVKYIPADSNGYYHFNNYYMARNEYDDGIRYDRKRVLNLLGTELDTSIRLVRDISSFSFSVDASFNGIITDFSISRSYGDVNRNVIILFCLFVIADYLFYAFVEAQKNRPGYEARYKTFLLLMATSLLVSLPLMLDFMVEAHDLNFHLIRIEGIKDAIINCQFPVRMNRYAITGQGYADPIFYPYLFLYFPAILRICGLTVMEAYKLFEATVIFAGVFISYCSFSEVLKDKRAAMIGMFLYNVAPYHLACLYTRGAVGEYLAYAFIPLVLWGASLLLEEETDSKSLKKGCLLLIVGFSGIIQSHILSCEMVGLFLTFAIILRVKRFMRIKTFVSFMVSGIITLALNLWFIVPFLLSFGKDYVVFGEPAAFTHTHSLMLYQLLGARSNLVGHSFSSVLGISNEMGISIGLALSVGIVIVLFEAVNLYKKRAENARNVRILSSFSVLSVLALWIISDLFPWYRVEEIPVLGSVFGMVQFPWRYLGIASLCLSFVMAAFFATKDSWNNYKKYAVILLIMAVTLCISNMDMIITKSEIQECYSIVTSTTLGNEEYFLGETRPDTLYTGYLVADLNFRKEGNKYYYSVENSLETPLEINTHINYYPFYLVKDMTTGEKYEPYANEYGCLAFVVPENYESDFCVSLPESKKWLLGDFISLITAVALVFAIVNEFRRKRVERSN